MLYSVQSRNVSAGPHAWTSATTSIRGPANGDFSKQLLRQLAGCSVVGVCPTEAEDGRADSS